MGGRERGLTRGLSSVRIVFENLILFLKQNTKDKSIRSGTESVFMSERSWVSGNQGVIYVKIEDRGYYGTGVQV